jgi:hypothetical protein
MVFSLPFLPVEVIVRRRSTEPTRWKLRDAMIAVAVLALALGLCIHVAGLGDRSRRLRAQSEHYAYLAIQDRALGGRSLITASMAEQWSRAAASSQPRLAADHATTATRLKESSVHWYRRAEYHDRLSRKYRHAQKYPLLPVWPDPPEP